jgi:hypothetical protein
MMPDLPNVGWERDIEAFREFFENPEFRCGVFNFARRIQECTGRTCLPAGLLWLAGCLKLHVGAGRFKPTSTALNHPDRSDGLKLYPTLVIRGTGELAAQVETPSGLSYNANLPQSPHQPHINSTPSHPFRAV